MNKIKIISSFLALTMTLSACSEKSKMTAGCFNFSSPVINRNSCDLEYIPVSHQTLDDVSSSSQKSETQTSKSEEVSSTVSKEVSKAPSESSTQQLSSTTASTQTTSSQKPPKNSSEETSQSSSSDKTSQETFSQNKESSSEKIENQSEEPMVKPTENPEKSQSSSNEIQQNSSYDSADYDTTIPNGELKAVWISYLDLNTILKGKSEGEFRSNIKYAFSNIVNMGLNTIIVQVRPFSDALYYSDIFPMSHIVTGTEGVDAGFDPLQIMIDYAHSYGLRLEAWINPYRIRNSGTKAEISADNPMYKIAGKNNDNVFKYSGGICYNPGSEEARQLIVDGVAEIVRKYAVDGIHFDDYFYPTTESGIDAKSYNEYQSKGGKLSLADFRRENVNILVRKVYSTIKSINPKVTFGISPQGNMDINYNSQYIDVEKWLSTPGYVDYICPQLYYGFDNKQCPFKETMDRWNNMIRADGVDLYVGIASYKIGTEDKWAGEKGINEWVNCGNMMKKMVLSARQCSNYKGFFLYRYDSLFNPSANLKNHVTQEINNLKSIIQH